MPSVLDGTLELNHLSESPDESLPVPFQCLRRRPRVAICIVLRQMRQEHTYGLTLHASELAEALVHMLLE